MGNGVTATIDLLPSRPNIRAFGPKRGYVESQVRWGQPFPRIGCALTRLRGNVPLGTAVWLLGRGLLLVPGFGLLVRRRQIANEVREQPVGEEQRHLHVILDHARDPQRVDVVPAILVEWDS